MCKNQANDSLSRGLITQLSTIFFFSHHIYLETGVELCMLTANYMLRLQDINHIFFSQKI